MFCGASLSCILESAALQVNELGLKDLAVESVERGDRPGQAVVAAEQHADLLPGLDKGRSGNEDPPDGGGQFLVIGLDDQELKRRFSLHIGPAVVFLDSSHLEAENTGRNRGKIEDLLLAGH